MPCKFTTLTVLNGYSNSTVLLFGNKVNGVVGPYDFSDTTRITLELATESGAVTIDSDVNPEAIDWSNNPSQGEVEFMLGALSLTVEAKIQTKMVVYKPGFPSGELLTLNDNQLFTFYTTVTNP